MCVPLVSCVRARATCLPPFNLCHSTRTIIRSARFYTRTHVYTATAAACMRASGVVTRQKRDRRQPRQRCPTRAAGWPPETQPTHQQSSGAMLGRPPHRRLTFCTLRLARKAQHITYMHTHASTHATNTAVSNLTTWTNHHPRSAVTFASRGFGCR